MGYTETKSHIKYIQATQLTFVCSKSTIETLEKAEKYENKRRQWHFSGAFIVNFEQI